MNRIVYTPSRPEKKLKKRFFRKFFFSVLIVPAVCILIAAFIYAIRLPAFQIRNIKISGAKALNEEEIRGKVFGAFSGNYGLILPRSSFFLAGSEKMRFFLTKEFPRIKDIAVSKKFPDTLNIEIHERDFWAILCNDLKTDSEIASSSPAVVVVPNCVYIDESGFSYDRAPDVSGALLLKVSTDDLEVGVGKNVISSAAVEKMQYLLARVRETIGSEGATFEVRKLLPREIRLRTRDGFSIFFNKDDDFQNVFSVLKKVMDKEIGEKKGKLEYIDLRFGNKVFYKMK